MTGSKWSAQDPVSDIETASEAASSRAGEIGDADKTGDMQSRTGQLRLGVAALGDLRWAVVDLRGPIDEARLRLDLSPVAAVALGRSLIAAALLLRFTTKNPGRLLLEIRGDGPLGTIVAEVGHRGQMRGLVGEPHVETPEHGLESIGWAVGQGLLQVTQESERGRYSSQVALVTGEVGDDLAHYLEQSQQIRSAALLGVLPHPSGIAAAGGLLIEAFPGVPEDSLARLEENLAELPGVSSILAEEGITGLLDRVLAGFDREELERHPLEYRCSCRAEALVEQLRTLGSEQLAELADERGNVLATCAFCNARYDFALTELLDTN